MSSSNTSSSSSGSGSSASKGDEWPGEESDEEGNADDPYLPLGDLCKTASAFHAIPKGDQAEPKTSIDLGQYDLSMDAANCSAGRFRIAVDFNVKGTISKTTAFHVQILDLMGREIGFINVQAKAAGVQKARGRITLTEANETILFRYEGGAEGNGNGKQSAVASVANSIEIQGISLYAKRSQVGGLAASIRAALHNPRSRIVLFTAGAIALLTLAGYAMAGRRSDSLI